MISSPPPGGLIAISAVFFVLQALAVIGRFSSRRRDKVSYGTDDYLVLAASIAYTAIFTIPAIIGAAGAGLGDHLKMSPAGMPIPPSETFNDVQFIFLTFHVIVLGLARCSILFLYKRIFLGKIFTIVVWTLIGWTVCWTIGFFFAFLFKCSPVTTATLPPPGTKCVNLLVLTKALGITSVLSDFFILLIPWPLVYRLHMDWSRKLAIGFVFLLGNLTLAASIVRCVVLFEIDVALEQGIPDFPYYDGINIVWAQLESAIAIVCSCLPALGRSLLAGLPKGISSLVSRIRLLSSNRSRSRRMDEYDLDDTNQDHSHSANGSQKSFPFESGSGSSRGGQIGVRRDVEVSRDSV